MSDQPPRDLVEIARSTYNFEQQLGQDHDEALTNAVAAALNEHRAQVISEVADIVLHYAATVELDDDEYDDEGVRGFLYYVQELVQKMGTPETEIAEYDPQSGDIIQLVLTGEVYRATSSGDWAGLLNNWVWVVQTPSGRILHFNLRRPAEEGVRVRLLDRED